jgi:hypothetical protein
VKQVVVYDNEIIGEAGIKQDKLTPVVAIASVKDQSYKKEPHLRKSGPC